MSTTPSGKEVVKFRDQEVRFSTCDGTVAQVERMQDISFSSSSGSVVIGGGFATITPPQLSGRTVNWQRIWIRTRDGKEFVLPVSDAVKARAGHEVGIVIASGKVGKEKRDQVAGVMNKTTGSWIQLEKYPPCDVYTRWASVWQSHRQAVARGDKSFSLLAIHVSFWIFVALPIWILMCLAGAEILTGYVAGTVIALLMSVSTATSIAWQSRRAAKAYAAAFAEYVRK